MGNQCAAFIPLLTELGALGDGFFYKPIAPNGAHALQPAAFQQSQAIFIKPACCSRASARCVRTPKAFGVATEPRCADRFDADRRGLVSIVADNVDQRLAGV